MLRGWREPGDRRLLVALALELVALWPAWVWYAARLVDAANEPWGLIAAVTAFLLPARRPSVTRRPASLTAPTLWLLSYAAAYPFVPALVSTLVALAVVGVTYSLWRHGTAWPAPRWGLVLL